MWKDTNTSSVGFFSSDDLFLPKTSRNIYIQYTKIMAVSSLFAREAVWIGWMSLIRKRRDLWQRHTTTPANSRDFASRGDHKVFRQSVDSPGGGDASYLDRRQRLAPIASMAAPCDGSSGLWLCCVCDGSSDLRLCCFFMGSRIRHIKEFSGTKNSTFNDSKWLCSGTYISIDISTVPLGSCSPHHSIGHGRRCGGTIFM